MVDRSSFVRPLVDALSYAPRALRTAVNSRFNWTKEDTRSVAQAKPGDIRLLIGPANFAGQGWEWARAVETLPGVAAVCLERGVPGVGFGFSADVLINTNVSDLSGAWARRQRKALAGFTHVLIEAGIPLYNAAYRDRLTEHVSELQNMGLKVGLIWHGSDVRLPELHAVLQPGSPLEDMSVLSNQVLQRRTKDNHRNADRLALREFVSTPDLLRFRPAATWLPTVVEAHTIPVGGPQRVRPVVLHAPSKAPLKGTERVREVCATLQHEGLLEYVEVGGVAHSEIPALLASSDIVIDSLGLGPYGVISIEAMLAERIAVCNVWSSARDAVFEETGLEVPVVQATAESLEQVLRNLVGRVDRDEIGARGRQFALAVHSREQAAKVLAGFMDSAPALQAQVIIPVHDLTRPIRRAVESVLSYPGASPIVVAHGVNASDLDLPEDPRVRVIEVPDGQGKPGVAFNAGLDAATAPWVGIMGSDDWYEAGAIEVMLRRLRDDDADGILSPIRPAKASLNSMRPVTWRRKNLRAARDRMFHRTAPLGLYRRKLLQNPRYQMADHVVAGVDQLSSVRLWTDGLAISYYPYDPAYVVGDDAKQRVTLTPRPLPVQGKMWREVWDDPEVRALPISTRNALGEKMVRVHVFDWISMHPTSNDLQQSDFEWLAELVGAIIQVAPGALDSLSPAELLVIEELRRGDLHGTLEAWQAKGASTQKLPWKLGGHRLPYSWPRRPIAGLASLWRERISRRFHSRKNSR